MSWPVDHGSIIGAYSPGYCAEVTSVVGADHAPCGVSAVRMITLPTLLEYIATYLFRYVLYCTDSSLTCPLGPPTPKMPATQLPKNRPSWPRNPPAYWLLRVDGRMGTAAPGLPVTQVSPSQ